MSKRGLGLLIMKKAAFRVPSRMLRTTRGFVLDGILNTA